jgi:hypothetical protein
MRSESKVIAMPQWISGGAPAFPRSDLRVHEPTGLSSAWLRPGIASFVLPAKIV